MAKVGGLDESDSVVSTDRGRRGAVERIQDADRVRLVGEVNRLVPRRPAQGAGLVARAQGAVDRLAPEDQGDDQARHVLVDPGKGRRYGDLDSGLFEDLALKRVGDRLVR